MPARITGRTTASEVALWCGSICAAFLGSGESAELAGIVIARAAYEGQPPNTSLFGNSGVIADRYAYRDDLLAIIDQPDCDDGLDDDGDGRIDYPADPGCSSPTDLSERASHLPCDNEVDEQCVGGCLVVREHRANRSARLVHVAVRDGYHGLRATEPKIGHMRAEPQPPPAEPALMAPRQDVDDLETDVVPGAFVLGPRIAEPDDDEQSVDLCRL